MSTPNYKQDEWPSHIPERAHFEAAYASDINNQSAQSEEEYLKWVKRFYLGWALYPNGWDWLTAKMLKQTSDEKQAYVKKSMYTIGERIGTEWSKDGAHRKINSSHLMTWGNVLRLALKRGLQYDLIVKISSDTKALLAEEIKSSEINFDRYFPEPNAAVAQDESEFDPFDA